MQCFMSIHLHWEVINFNYHHENIIIPNYRSTDKTAHFLSLPNSQIFPRQVDRMRTGRSKMATSIGKLEARAVIRLPHLQGKSASEIHNQVTAVCQDGIPSYYKVVRWKRCFHCEEITLEDLLLRNRVLWHRWKLGSYLIDT
jgi:hypothetical protein